LVAGFVRRRRALLCGWLRRRRGSRVLFIGVQLPESHSDSGSARTEKRSRKAIVIVLSVRCGLGLRYRKSGCAEIEFRCLTISSRSKSSRRSGFFW
jgi:hypothetical protein